MKKTVIALVVCLTLSGCTSVFPAPTRSAADKNIPGGGGSILVIADRGGFQKDFAFTPDISGRWAVYTSNSHDYTLSMYGHATGIDECSPRLSVFDSHGGLIASDLGGGNKLQFSEGDYWSRNIPYYDTGGRNLNARIETWFEAGATYNIKVDFGEINGECILTIAPENIDPLPNSGGSVRIGAETYYDFTPDRTGLWSFQSSDIGQAYPLLAIFAPDGDLIMYDHDKGGALDTAYYWIGLIDPGNGGILTHLYSDNDDVNARMDVNLEAGKTYTLYAGFVEGIVNPYTLNVYAPRPIPLPNGGGEIRVPDTTYYSFSPDKAGIWLFNVSDTTGGNPEVAFYDAQGNALSSDTCRASNRVDLYLEAGGTYYIHAAYNVHRTYTYTRPNGPYTLNVTRLPTLSLPSGEGSVQIDREAEYVFSPDRSGRWEFLAPCDGRQSPYLAIYDARGRSLAPPDSGGEYARLSADLEAGSRYSLFAGFSNTFWHDPYPLGISLLPDLSLPAGGGSVRVLRESDYAFRPNRSGRWLIRAIDSEGEMNSLLLYDQQGKLIASDKYWNPNSRLLVYLEAGSRYIINAAGNLRGWEEPYTLNVTPMPVSSMPAGGGSVQVDQERDYRFSPGQSGRWEFSTSATGECSPALILLDARYQTIAPDPNNDRRTSPALGADLEAGLTYIIHAGYLRDKICGYTLTVSPGG